MKRERERARERTRGGEHGGGGAKLHTQKDQKVVVGVFPT
jgi:hypothetical protein